MQHQLPQMVSQLAVLQQEQLIEVDIFRVQAKLKFWKMQRLGFFNYYKLQLPYADFKLFQLYELFENVCLLNDVLHKRSTYQMKTQKYKRVLSEAVITGNMTSQLQVGFKLANWNRPGDGYQGSWSLDSADLDCTKLFHHCFYISI